MNLIWYTLFLDHPNSTNNPQGYWSHGIFSAVNSAMGLVYMIAGIIHGVFPYVFPFTTSSWIIKAFIKLVQSERHKKELEKYISSDILLEIKNQIHVTEDKING